jgi:hypothetical protein
MLRDFWQVRDVAGTVIVGLAVGLSIWLFVRPDEGLRTIPTGAGFSIAVTRSQNGANALRLASTIESTGLPAFTRSLKSGTWRQVVVGPYVSLDEAEQVLGYLASRGFGARLLVDESVRRRPGHDGVPLLSATASLVLVSGAGRLSLVAELPDEPRQVETRRVSPTMLEVDVGPVSGPIPAQQWLTPNGVGLIDGIWTEEAFPGEDPRLRIRLSVSDATLSNARILGNRVYIDLWSADTLKGSTRERTFPNRGVGIGRPAPVPARPPQPEFDYREIIAPTVARLETVGPFVLAAVAAPSPDVLKALAGTLASLKDWLLVVEPPATWAETHRSLVAVVTLAMSSVEPGFSGSRTARAQEAFALFDKTKAALQTSQTPPTTIATTPPATIVRR